MGEVVSEMEALDVPEDCKHSNKDKQMSIGRKKFNMDPKKGEPELLQVFISYNELYLLKMGLRYCAYVR